MLTMIFRRMFGAAIALGVVVGAQFVLSEAARAESPVVYLPIAPSGMETPSTTLDLLYALESLPSGIVTAATSGGPCPYVKLPRPLLVRSASGAGSSCSDHKVVDFKVGNIRYIGLWGHVSELQQQRGWYKTQSCDSEDCTMPYDQLIVASDYDWGESAGTGALPGIDRLDDHKIYYTPGNSYLVQRIDGSIFKKDKYGKLILDEEGKKIVVSSKSVQRVVFISGSIVNWSNSSPWYPSYLP